MTALRERLLHSYAPRGTAKSLMRIKDPEVLVSGPAGTGKSRACMEKLHFMMLRYSGARGLIVRKTATSLTTSALRTWRRDVVPEALTTGAVEWYGGSAQEPAQYRYENGSVVAVAGMDKSSRIMSSEYDVIYVQEATELTEDDWEALTTRLRNNVIPYQQLIADCNPAQPTHWLKVRSDLGKTKFLHSRHEDNPVLFTETTNSDGRVIHSMTTGGRAYMTKLDNLTGVRHQRLRKGLWVAAEGLIYEEWNPSVHLIDRFEPSADWTRWWSIDFGFVNPFVCQLWAEHEGKLFMYKEVYYTRRLVEDHAQSVLTLVRGPDGWIEPKPRAIVCDHDAEGRATFEKAVGLSTSPAHKKVLEGIQAVQQRLKDQRLFIMRDSRVSDPDQELVDAKKPTCTAEEVPGYVWDTGAGKAPKEQPLKADDHGCDAMRYLVAEVDMGIRPRVRWL